MTAVSHGGQQPVPAEAALHPDPDLWLVRADWRVWDAAHPCTCDALCVCEAEAE